LALSAHGTKATARAAINISPEPFSNIVVSLVEDVVAIVSIVMALLLPLALILLITAFVLTSLFVLPRILRMFRGRSRNKLQNASG